MHGPITESDHEDATVFWFRIPLGFASVTTFLLASNIYLRALGLTATLAMIFLPRKIVDIIGSVLYLSVITAGIISILLRGV